MKRATDIMRRMFLLYEVLLYLVFLLAFPFFLITGLLRGKYLANFPERMGFYRTPAAAHDLWIHAVSVGETLASRPVIDEVVRRRPGTSIVFTTTTITGQAQAQRLYPEATITYFPFDFTTAVKRFLDHHRPRVFAAMLPRRRDVQSPCRTDPSSPPRSGATAQLPPA